MKPLNGIIIRWIGSNEVVCQTPTGIVTCKPVGTLRLGSFVKIENGNAVLLQRAILPPNDDPVIG